MCREHGLIWLHPLQKKWILVLNLIVVFTLLAYIIGYPPASQQAQTNRSKVYFDDTQWPEILEDSPAAEGNFIPCTPKKNIVFLKTHKCASSSVQNIFLRYAHQRNLTVVLPVLSKTHYLSRLRPFRREMIAGSPWEGLGYNILCHHMVFNQAELEKLMPSDSIFISIVRNPVNLFESLYEYDKLEDFYKMDIEEYARATRNVSAFSKIRKRIGVMGRNPMLYDFGVSPRFYNSHRAIQEAIRKLDTRFDFVMVAEHFDESIAILRRILCWDVDDVVSLTINARMQSFKKNLSEEAVTNLQHWHWGDQMLYKHFVDKFHKTVEEFGREKLAQEVSELQQRREEWFRNCVEETVDAKNLTVYNIWSDKVVGFKLKTNQSNETCEDLVKPEKFFTNEIRQHQIIRALANGSARGLSVYRMIDLSKLKGDERVEAQRVLINYYRQRKSRRSKFFSSLKVKKPLSSEKH